MKKITLLLAALLLFTGTLSAQDTKGVRPINQPTSQPINQTRAVVVGISNYQDNGIPDLKYAHRDAEAFAEWLRSPAGGNVPERNLVLLTNQKATTAQFAKALDGLIETAREGDQVIIYFSGHGDVETKTMRQNGFLLCYDSPAATYMAGAYALTFLQDVVATLSLQNMAKVVVITDACRAGKLAGSSINGTQLTSANLAKQFANETKLLSCQHDEYSLEGEQWGGGRGVFSYHLIDGLTGLADANEDGMVLSRELLRYLQDKVTAEAEPAAQNPMLIGSMTEKLAFVDAPALAALRQVKTGAAPMFGSTGMKGWEDELVAATDSATQALYYAYKGAVEHGALIDTAAGYSNAWALLPQLLQRESLRELHGLLKRNLAAALQDEAQQALNALLNDDPYEHNQWMYNPEKYARYPEYLTKSIELLGERHYMYKTLMAKKLFFEARTLKTDMIARGYGEMMDDSINRYARNLLRQGLQFEADGAYLYYALGNTFHNNVLQADSFQYYHNQALALAPTWTMPRMAFVNQHLFLGVENPDYKTCEQYLLEGLALKPESFLLKERLVWTMQRMFRMNDALELAKDLIRLRPDLMNGYATLATTFARLRQYDLAEEYMKKALEVDSTVWVWPAFILRSIYLAKREYESVFQIYRKIEDKGLGVNDPLFYRLVAGNLPFPELAIKESEYYFSRYPMNYENPLPSGRSLILLLQGKKAEAKAAFLYDLTLDPTPNPSYILILTGLARIAADEQQADSAEYYFKRATNYYVEILGSWLSPQFYPFAHYHYARFLLTQNRFADAEAQLLKAEGIDPRNPLNYYGMAALHASQKHDAKALDWLAKALEWYYADYDEIMAEPLFKKLRKTKRFKVLVKKFFPNGSDKPKVEALARKYMPEVFGN